MRPLILATVVVGLIVTPLTAIAQSTPTTTAVTVVNPQGSGNTTSTATSVRGQPVAVAFAVTAGSGAAAPDGSAVVYIDGFNTCTVALGSPVGLTATGTCNVPAPLALSIGSHTITASYTGTATFGASASSGAGNGSLTVMNASTTTAITAHTPDPSMVNSPIAVTVVVTVTPPGVADGNGMPVQVSDGSVTCMLPPTSMGQPGTCNLTPTTAGTKTLVATSLGQGGYNGGVSPGVSHTVSGGGSTPTTTAITIVNPQGSGNTTSTATSVRGQPVAVTFAVTAGSGAAAPDGSAVVYIDGFNTCTVALGSPVGLTATGTCNVPAPLALSIGSHTITASYTGTATFGASASSGAGNGSLTVMNASTTTAITAHTPDPSMVNSPIAVTVVVTVTPPGVADGNGMPVQVSDGSVTCMLPPTSMGQPGTCNLTPTTAGTKTLVATSLGQGGYNGGVSPGVSHTVSGGGSTPTTTAITIVNPQGSGNTTSTATSVRGQPVAVTFAVTAGSGAAAPDGSAVVYIDGFNTCTVALGSPVGLTATGTCNVPAPLALSIGSHTITASYTGTATFGASASSGAGNGSLTVMNASTTTAITAHTPDPSMVNSPIAVTVVVTVTPPGVADGNGMPVQVSDGSVTCMLPPTSMGQPGTCNLTPTTAGTKTLVATSLGQGGYNGGVSPGVSHTVSGGGTLANYQGIWWNAPANSESGWGINLAHQGDKIFASWFTYDTMGRGWWLVMTATETGANTYSGKLYQTMGPAFNAVPFDPLTVVATEVGTGTLVFTDANNGTFNYVIGSTNQTKPITHEVFGPLPVCTFGAVTDLTTATNYQDLWWRMPANSESGWGINLNHQGNTIFATWFTYDLNGAPLWLVVTAVNSSPGVYTGDLYQTIGPAFNVVPFDASKVVATKVGTATFTVVDGNNLTFAYSVQLSGMTAPSVQTKPITREILTAPGTVCQ